MIMPATMKVLFLLTFSALGQSLSITSSKSSKKNRFQPKTNKTGGGGGFGGGGPSLLKHKPDTSTSIQNLINFLDKQGALGLSEGAGMEVGYDEKSGIRGIFCTAAFKKAEIICQIPSDCALALSDPSSEQESGMVQASVNFLNFYADHPEASQTWKPYLDSLPTLQSQFDATPDFYDDDELELCEFPTLMEKARDRQTEIGKLSKGNDFPLDKLQFATWLVSSRCFNIALSESSQAEQQVDDQGRPLLSTKTRELRVLVPLLDLANHASSVKANAELHLIDPHLDDAWFALKATRSISPGQEICISYGSGIESSVELLLNYGFVPNDNAQVDKLMMSKWQEKHGSVAWSTTLEEDESMLQQATGRLQTILRLRANLKRASQVH
jgi:hypothetical protein